MCVRARAGLSGQQGPGCSAAGRHQGRRRPRRAPPRAPSAVGPCSGRRGAGRGARRAGSGRQAEPGCGEGDAPGWGVLIPRRRCGWRPVGTAQRGGPGCAPRGAPGGSAHVVDRARLNVERAGPEFEPEEMTAGSALPCPHLPWPGLRTASSPASLRVACAVASAPVWLVPARPLPPPEGSAREEWPLPRRLSLHGMPSGGHVLATGSVHRKCPTVPAAPEGHQFPGATLQTLQISQQSSTPHCPPLDSGPWAQALRQRPPLRPEAGAAATQERGSATGRDSAPQKLADPGQSALPLPATRDSSLKWGDETVLRAPGAELQGARGVFETGSLCPRL